MQKQTHTQELKLKPCLSFNRGSYPRCMLSRVMKACVSSSVRSVQEVMVMCSACVCVCVCVAQFETAAANGAESWVISGFWQPIDYLGFSRCSEVKRLWISEHEEKTLRWAFWSPFYSCHSLFLPLFFSLAQRLHSASNNLLYSRSLQCHSFCLRVQC